ncbi:MAG: UDP-N-acetylglucosamine 2-epimerase [Candidatus Gorgyraea atricola]|nr:UDP-N-acetylglucosamine 2-epimerase [Candidatus Gorgyraea atricola]
MKRNICVVTGSRAEYGLLRPLLEKIKNTNGLKLSLIVTGMHLSSDFGLTYKEIERDGFCIDEKVNISIVSDTPLGVSRSMGLAMRGISRAYERIKPDIVVMLGDRFEIFSAASAALIARIPVAHIHGGEITEGAFDDAMRHSITKMSHLHFTSTEEYRKRVIQLGEQPNRVFNVGAIGLDNINKIKLLSKATLEKKLNLKFNKHNLLVTFHPVTLENNTSKIQFNNLLKALDRLKDTYIIFTKSNADTYGRIINKMIDEYVSRKSDKAISFTSMGQLKYLSTMQFVDAVVGNSSSGIIEAPSFKIGTINIGDRQKGRIRAKSIIDCAPIQKDINRAFGKLYSKKFQDSLRSVKNLHGNSGSAKKITEILKSYNLKDIIKKHFFDVNFEF